MRNLYLLRTIGGVPVRVHYSWIIVALLGLVALPRAVFPSYMPDLGLLGGLGLALLVLALYCCVVLVHTLAQLAVARLLGVRFAVLNLYPLGALTRRADRGGSPRAAFVVAAAGPVASIALWWALDRIAGGGVLTSMALAVALYVTAQLSFYLGLINLLPGLPLDGGRMLRALLWGVSGSLESATRLARVSGQVIAYGLIVLGAGSLLASEDWLRGLALVLVGWQVRAAGGSAYRRALIAGLFDRLTAADVLRAPERTIAPERSLREFAELLRGRTGTLPTPVLANDMFLGMIDRAALWEVPQGYWDERTVAEIMTPAAQLHTVAPDTPVSALMPWMVSEAGAQAGILPVVQAGRLAGVLDAEELGELLEIEQEFGLCPRPALGRAARHALPAAFQSIAIKLAGAKEPRGHIAGR
jgi:Zn-dependent protease